MAADDVKQTLELAVTRTGVTGVRVRHRPRLLSDNGPCYLAGELEDYLAQQGISHTRSRPYHPMTQGKIEGTDHAPKKALEPGTDDRARNRRQTR